MASAPIGARVAGRYAGTMTRSRIAPPADLAHLLRDERDRLLADWERRVRRLPKARALQTPWLLDDIPLLIEELAQALETPEAGRAEMLRSALGHGRHRLAAGFELGELVEEYRFLRQCIFELAERHGLVLAGPACATVNEFIDRSVSQGVQAYVEHRDQAERRRREEHLSFIVHDLRSPLSAIYQGTMIIEKDLRGLPVSERARAMLAAIQRNIQRMQALIVKVLQEEANIRASPNVEVRRSPVELRAVVENAVRTLEPLARSNETRVENAVPPGTILEADPTLLERVFQNLISNAIDYAPRGAVTIGARRHPEGDLECWVSDDGPGIPEALRDRIFDKHLTDPQRRGGAGLGLAIVKQLVEAHGGRVELQTQTGQGTTFRLVLPTVGAADQA